MVQTHIHASSRVVGVSSAAALWRSGLASHSHSEWPAAGGPQRRVRPAFALLCHAAPPPLRPPPLSGPFCSVRWQQQGGGPTSSFWPSPTPPPLTFPSPPPPHCPISPSPSPSHLLTPSLSHLHLPLTFQLPLPTPFPRLLPLLAHLHHAPFPFPAHPVPALSAAVMRGQ